MNLLAPIALALLLPSQAEPSRNAKELAQEILTQGTSLFDTRDDAAMAATYTENAEILFYSRDKDSGDFKIETYHGRVDIQKGYGNVFKDRPASARSLNHVEAAYYISPDLLVIHGAFTLDTNDSNLKPIPFIQVRFKQGGTWRILTLHLFFDPKK